MENGQCENKLQQIAAMCKDRGFIFQSSEIYGGLRSAYDYGPLGVELKRNIMNQWWEDMVYSRDNVVGLDASIMMHPQVWEASGHVSSFSDPLVDCKICKERFRADKAPIKVQGDDTIIILADKGRAKVAQEQIRQDYQIELKRDGNELHGALVKECGYVCPNCGSPFLSEERQFNLMFRTFLGSVDPLQEIVQEIEKGTFQNVQGKEIRSKIEYILKSSNIYLRPETAAMFVQFMNATKYESKNSFGINNGKSFEMSHSKIVYFPFL